MLEAEGRISAAPKSRTGILYIPSDLLIDSAFPFKLPAKVNIRIDGEKLIVEKAP